MKHKHAQALRWSKSASCPYGASSARLITRLGAASEGLLFLPCLVTTFLASLAFFFREQSLVASSSFLYADINLRTSP